MTEVFLRPGEVFIGDRSHRVRTLLGSCVSITLWDERLRVGAMSHFLLAGRGRPADGPLDGRFADEALALMLQGLQRLGASAQRCEAKLFGGGHMFPERALDEAFQVGRRNGETAVRLLQLHGIALRSQSLFGAGHRRIAFDIDSGHVWACQVRPADLVS